MSQFRQTSTGDLYIANGRFELVDGREEIRQRISQRLQFLFGEWFLDTTLGLPWIQVIFEKGTPASQIDDLIKNEILSTRGVTGFKSYTPIDVNQQTRTMTIEFSVLSTDGVLDISQEVST